ncbi:DUF2892 domain-containing protein [Candidatus Micrarchaeota archaeon]|nr:DUF2892 domain-containing protein [Candidatus Micrarchaeota archaeon]
MNLAVCTIKKMFFDGLSMKLEVNEGKIDRFFRIVFGLVFLGGGYLYLAAPLSWAVMLVGAILVVTGVTGYCGVYSVLGISTVGVPYCDIVGGKK